MSHRTVVAFGEEKRICDWARDPRCVVDPIRLSMRLRRGWSEEDAIVRPTSNYTIKTDDKLESLKSNVRWTKWLDENPDATRGQMNRRANFLLNEERERESNRKWSNSNQEVVTKRTREWRQSNPERARFHELNRERRLHATPKELIPSNQALADWKELYGQSCCYCGTTGKLSLEHIIPISRGGLHTLSNILWACKSCNSSKGNDTFIIWLWKKCNKSIHNNEN